MLPGITPFLAKPPAAVAQGGYNDSDTKIMLHFDNSISAGVFHDTAIGAWSHTFTPHGGVTQSATQVKFGRRSCFFGGVNADYLDTPLNSDYALGSSDFTIEMWVKRGGTLTNQVCFAAQCASSISDGVFYFDFASGTIRFVGFFTDASNTNVNGAVTWDTNWHHIAAERDGSTMRVYFDGAVIASASIAGKTFKTSTWKLAIGQYGEWLNSGFNLNGYVDEFRLCLAAKFKGAFTPSTLLPSAYEVNPGTGQGNDSNTVLLLHADGSNGSTSFTDSCIGGAGPKTMTSNGATNSTEGIPRFGTASIKYGSASATRITTPQNADFDFGSGDFTLDAWVYRFGAETNVPAIVGKRATNSEYAPFLLALGNNGICYFYATTANGTWNIANALQLGTIPLFTWTHVAIVRIRTTIYGFINGACTTYCAAAQNSLYANSNVLGVGGTSGDWLLAYLDEVRVSRCARWSNMDFTVPDRPYGGGTKRTIKTATLTTGTSYSVPTDWSTNNIIECYGAGGAGGSGHLPSFDAAGGGGGGGAFGKLLNLTGLTPGGTTPCQIGQPGNGNNNTKTATDTFFGAASLAAAQVGAQSGWDAGSSSSSGQGGVGGSGGTAASSKGTTKFDGGSGGTGAPDGPGQGGGGGCAGPLGVGGTGGNGSGSSPGTGGPGNGGLAGNGDGGAGATNYGGGGAQPTSGGTPGAIRLYWGADAA